MDSFKEKLLRLKNELKISTDKEVAEALGMKPTAFAERKKTNSFPDKQVFELARQKPDLDIDYILLGHRRKVFERMEQEALKDMAKADEPLFNIHRDLGNVTVEEILLLQHFRLLNKSQRAKAFDAIKGLVLSQFLDEGRFPELSAELARSIVR